MTQNSGPDGKLKSQVEPRLELVPSPGVHTDLAARSLAALDEQRTAALIEIGSASASAS
jgi:hypothetical protein